MSTTDVGVCDSCRQPITRSQQIVWVQKGYRHLVCQTPMRVVPQTKRASVRVILGRRRSLEQHSACEEYDV